MESEFEGELKTKVLNYGRTGYETEANIDRLQKEVSTYILVFVFLIKLFLVFHFIVKDYLLQVMIGCLLLKFSKILFQIN